MTPPVFVAAVGDARDPNTWSGIPFHLWQAGKKLGFIEDALPLRTEGWDWTVRRSLWNALRLTAGDRKGGYQYSVQFLEKLWRPELPRLAGASVISCFQLFPPSLLARRDIAKWCYIDLTLTQVFDYYRLRDRVGTRIAADAAIRERMTYQEVAGIITMSQFAADAVVREHGIPESRIHVVVPGANLDPALYRDWEREEEGRRHQRRSRGEPLKLVMVTTDWQRKGLDRVLRAFALGRRQGLRATLRVVGANKKEVPATLAEVSGVEWLGRISKRTDAGRFFRAVCDADVGCLFPRYEAGGSVLREYHGLGLAAFCTTAGGMPDFMFADATVTVDPDASDEEILAKLMMMDTNREIVEELRAAAWRRRHEALWHESAQKLQRLVCS